MTKKKLKTGLIIINTDTRRSGVVIDWGLKNVNIFRYMPLPASKKKADAVRVWTSSGKTVEVWPISSVKEYVA